MSVNTVSMKLSDAQTINETEVSESTADTGQYNEAVITIDATITGTASFDPKIEFSPNGTDWYEIPAAMITGGNFSTFNATSDETRAVPVLGEHLRVNYSNFTGAGSFEATTHLTLKSN